MHIPHAHIGIFVATRREDVPAVFKRYLSVDGSVPGAALAWDHHRSGERINLDAMPDQIEPFDYDAVGTTSADTDAVASVVAVLFGGKAVLPLEVRQVLEAASYRCDHLGPHPDHNERINELGRGLHGYVSQALHEPSAQAEAFERVCRQLADLIAAQKELPFDTSGEDAAHAQALQIEQQGRIHCEGQVALVDLMGLPGLAPEALYARMSCPVCVMLQDHPRGGRRYTVGTNPFAPQRPASIEPALHALAAAEYRHGAPALRPEPVPGAENWGGRATVFGSPWNYGSRLEPREVQRLVAEALFGRC